MCTMERQHPVRFIFTYMCKLVSYYFAETTFRDMSSVASRAVRAIDTSITLDIANMYAEYMLRMAAWEIENAKATCLKTLSKHFPSIKAQVYEKMNFYSPHIYIGTRETRCHVISSLFLPGHTEDMSLCFWIRMCPAMESLSDDTGKSSFGIASRYLPCNNITVACYRDR